jgi:methylated-DNA-protein-cysteine methyltransferase-like protein
MTGPAVRAIGRRQQTVGVTVSAFAAQVLDVVARIPPGYVLTYGDVAEYVGAGSARSVGAVLRRHGHEVPWQRVVLATGAPAPAAPQRALFLLRRDGAPLVPAGDRVDLARGRWDGRPGRPGCAGGPEAGGA